MKERKLHLPSFLSNQVNKILDKEGLPTSEIIPENKMMLDNIIANIEAADGQWPADDLRDTIFICIRQKADGSEAKYQKGDYKYSIAAIPFGDEDLVTVSTYGFDKIPTILFNAKADILEIITRILKNLAFS